MHRASVCPRCSNGEGRQNSVGEQLIKQFPVDVRAAISNSSEPVIRCSYCCLVYLKDGSSSPSLLGYWNSYVRGLGWRTLRGDDIACFDEPEDC